LPYDVLSINVGATPALDGVRGDVERLIRTKPIDRFLGQWAVFEQRARTAQRVSVSFVGGGAAGVELALAALHRLRSLGVAAEVALVTAADEILVGHNRRVRQRFDALLRTAGVRVHRGIRIVERTADGIVDAEGNVYRCDEVVWATQAAPTAWPGASGLAVDERGFILVDGYLRSTSHADVFAAGDVASSVSDPRPKAGVFAVRQGPALARNLRAALLELPLRRFRPQRRFLSLISAGGRDAVASRGVMCAAGAWVWRWKDRIDRRFMERYSLLETMSMTPAGELAPALRRLVPAHATPDDMRCGGCGAKLPAESLRAALAGLGAATSSGGAAVQLDDAAVMRVPEAGSIAVSIDAFRPLVTDPYVFGEICANHALNDLYAMGAEPSAAVALVSLPVWPSAKLTAEWVQMMAGARAVFTAAGADIVGGHSSEAREVMLGFAVIGQIGEHDVWRKDGLRSGDMLVLTKPLGTGTLLAADMRARADALSVAAAIDTMRQSNHDAVTCLRAFDPSAVTDVTGFGLAGHLLEMLSAAGLRARIRIGDVPVLRGAREALGAGWRSSLHDSNRENARSGMADALLGEAGAVELLFDPQTAGGLLAGVRAAQADACVAALRLAGYEAAAVIGRVETRDPSDGCMLLVE
jgi:selenide,water dikinase